MKANEGKLKAQLQAEDGASFSVGGLIHATDVIGGFPYTHPDCKGCGKPLELANAWMTDGCPCNHPLGINSKNEIRWRLLMQLQQKQSRELERLKAELYQATHCAVCDQLVQHPDGALHCKECVS